MSDSSANKKSKRPKPKTQSVPESSRQVIQGNNKAPDRKCPLAAKDSEWVDILQTLATDSVASTNVSDEEEVECEDGPQMRPLAIMFPGLLEKDPNTLEGVLNKVMSTTEVTKHLVDLGQKANFTLMKKADRLIPKDKQWLERLTENSNSLTSMASTLFGASITSGYDAANEVILALGGEDDVDANEIDVFNDSNPDARNANTYNEINNIEQSLSEIIQTNETVSPTKGRMNVTEDFDM